MAGIGIALAIHVRSMTREWQANQSQPPSHVTVFALQFLHRV